MTERPVPDGEDHHHGQHPDGPLVSVVVPVFNAAEHLRDCLNSLVAQTLWPIEIIAVDDGSTDGSAAILAEEAAVGNLRVITQERNGGVSLARNTGLNAASGTYVAFVDADDTVSVSMYAELHAVAKRHDADIVACGLRTVDSSGVVLAVEDFPLRPGIVHDRIGVRSALHTAWRDRLLWHPTRSLYRRSLLIHHDVTFDEEIRKGEDSLFNLRALDHSERVVALDRALYDYRKHPGSATAKPLASESGNLEKLGQVVSSYYTEHGFDQRAIVDFHQHVLRSDLPTAIVRLQWHATPRREIRALLATPTVRGAFRSHRISALDVPTRVRLILVLSRLRLPGAIALLLRVSSSAGRLRRR